MSWAEQLEETHLVCLMVSLKPKPHGMPTSSGANLLGTQPCGWGSQHSASAEAKGKIKWHGGGGTLHPVQVSVGARTQSQLPLCLQQGPFMSGELGLQVSTFLPLYVLLLTQLFSVLCNKIWRKRRKKPSPEAVDSPCRHWTPTINLIHANEQ